MSETAEGRLWVRLIKGHRVDRSETIRCRMEEAPDALRDLLQQMDLSQPIWLDRHQKDWQEFALAVFRPEHFMEPVPFDRMELSYIEDGEKKPKTHPRNPAWDA